VVTEAVIRDVLHLDDAEGVDCLPNEEIFTELACMGYEKPYTKLTFYKAFFSSQWKFLIHIILQSMSAKRTSWNEFSTAMASAVICLSTGRKFNFSEYIFESLVRNVDSSSKFYMYPRIESSDDTIMEDVSNQGRMIDELDKDECAVLMNEKEETEEVKDITGDAQVEGRQAEIYQIDMDHAVKVLSMQEDEPEIQEAVEVVTTTKLITKVVVAVSETVNATHVVPTVTTAVVPTITTAPVKVAIPSTRRRRGVVIRDPDEESSAKTPTKSKSKDKGKCIMKAAKRIRLNEEAEDVEELKQYLEIMPDEDDDVYIEATPLARKVPVVDYQIVYLNNKPHYKIIRADADYACRKKIPTLEVYIGLDAEYSTAKSGRAE
nr:synaptobrevin, longin-like domain protein [Tanacetum cinerariifolium]